MTKETGGPAFPTSDWDENGRAYKIHGTTLRDYFAAKAMQAILSNPEYGDEDDSLAGAAYYVADAMLKARKS
jgi:hypothetical protein